MYKIATHWLLSPLFLVLAGCSALKPPPEPSATLKSAYDQSQTLPNAVAFARNLRDAYAARSADMRQDEKLNGLALIGLGMVAGDLVARGIGQSETLGLGLTGVGLYSANNWANPRSERQLYADAARAMHCAIGVMEPLRPAYEQFNELQRGVDRLRSKADALDAMLAGFVGSEEPRVVRARNAVTKARAARSAGVLALGVLKSAGPSLVTAVEGMRVDVEVQLNRSGPDYGTLVASLIQQKVLPATAPLTFPDSKAKEAGSASTLEQPTAQLEDETAAAEQIVALVNQRPSAADLQNCRVDLAASGITMKVEPAMVSLKAGERTVALVSGGTPAYSVVPLADAATADQLVFSVASSGVITIEAKSGAKPATYTTYVLDKGKGRETLIVTVAAAAPASTTVASTGKPTGTGTGTNGSAGACAKPDAAVKELQDGLRKLGITKVKVDPADANEVEVQVDGCAGKITKAAVRKFYTDIQHLPADDVQTDEAKLIQEGKVDVKSELAKKK